MEARNYLFSFQNYVYFEEFFVSRDFVRFGAKHSSLEAFGFDNALELFLRTPLRHRAFLRTPTTTTSILLKFSIHFFKTEPVFLA